MSYVAVKGGEKAIRNAEQLLQAERRGEPSVPELSLAQIKQQMGLAIARVMSEGSLYDLDLAALAIKQSWGDFVEAAFLLRAYRTTLPRFYYSEPLDTSGMAIERRISSIYKDVPGGQQLGPTFDYVHRLLDFKLAAEDNQFDYPTASPTDEPKAGETEQSEKSVPRAIDALNGEGLIQQEATVSPDAQDTIFDLTRQPLELPAGRDARLQNLARADEGFLLGLAYSTQRGYGNSHPFAGEIRMGEVEVFISPEELGFEVAIGSIAVTEVQMVTQFKGSKALPPQFTRGYGLSFGYSERKAMAMALVDRSLRAKEFGEAIQGAAQEEEFVLYHSDNVEAQGFVQHLKLPHYIDFQAELNLVRKMRETHFEKGERGKGEIETGGSETGKIGEKGNGKEGNGKGSNGKGETVSVPKVALKTGGQVGAMDAGDPSLAVPLAKGNQGLAVMNAVTEGGEV
ncbi:MAG: carbon-phosphorus lyase complex subunit PhnI [Cyanobacteria bacterium P01_F01_bin.53]